MKILLSHKDLRKMVILRRIRKVIQYLIAAIVMAYSFGVILGVPEDGASTLKIIGCFLLKPVGAVGLIIGCLINPYK